MIFGKIANFNPAVAKLRDCLYLYEYIRLYLSGYSYQQTDVVYSEANSYSHYRWDYKAHKRPLYALGFLVDSKTGGRARKMKQRKSYHTNRRGDAPAVANEYLFENIKL